ncbi:hypothetical protein [Lysinibacillus xylanilyticus]|uniref:Uncharacterized protein n=1 Tax=Lysinibacillus xylanilyticus TaxID=582475 RepID=A0ABT4EMA8_9BACI|nr:hypothetical protein [Lysinibacillus xylanilyticus]MCY9546797.1 hypothetical protein [Lysinibacillus xylanilyticus]
MTNNSFYYAYSPNLYRHLKALGFRYICTGLNESTMRQFWQYERTPELSTALMSYAENKPAK